MATVNAEVQELIAEVRKLGFTAALEGKHYVILRDGQRVVDEEGPLSLACTPSDRRWRKNTVARLIRAKVLDDDPKKIEQKRLARRTRPEDVDAVLRRAQSAQEVEREKQEPRYRPTREGAEKARLIAETEELRERMKKVLELLAISQAELVRTAMQIGAEKATTWQPGSKKSLEQNALTVMGAKSKRPYVTEGALEFWDVVLTELGAPKEEAVQVDEQAAIDTEIAEMAKIGFEPAADGKWRCKYCMKQYTKARAFGHSKLHIGSLNLVECPAGCGQSFEAAAMASHLMFVHRLRKENGVLVPFEQAAAPAPREAEPEKIDEQIREEIREEILPTSASGIVAQNGSPFDAQDAPLEMRALAVMCAGHTDAALLNEALRLAQEIRALRVAT